jgi:hypothetical protein
MADEMIMNIDKANVNDAISGKFILFATGLIVFLWMAILGWGKLQYGFNFIDEGMYMTDGWRMAVGDMLFPDNSTNVTFLYTVFNEYVFKLNPDITLYGFRKLQYCCAIFSMLLLATAVYRWTREFWYLPFALSLFAFTGLDANGMASNLSYYVYPHFFITLYIALLLFALKQQQGITRVVLFALSGACLWGIGFSLLPLTVTLICPIVLWLLFNRWCMSGNSFSTRDLVVVYLPIIFAWCVFIAFNGVDFFDAVGKMYGYLSEFNQGRYQLLLEAIPYVCFSLILVAALIAVGHRSTLLSLIVAAGFSAIIFAVINTNLFEVIPPFWGGWFNSQMWLASLVVSTWIMGLSSIFFQYKKTHMLDDTSQLFLVLLIPCIIMGGLFVFFSSLGPLTVQSASIPTMLALAVLVAQWARGSIRGLLILTLMLGPFYYSMAWADWKFTYFDLPPKYLTSTFTQGFATGIRTNKLYFSMATWMQEMSHQYSQEGDFAIVTDQTPMGYMLINRRPALNHSWGGLGNSKPLRRDAVAQMIRDKREPKIAFRFVSAPLFLPTSIREEKYALGGQSQMNPDDPIDGYMMHNMKHVDSFFFQQRTWIELYIR